MDGGWWPEAKYVEGVLAEVDTNVTIEQVVDHEYGTDWMKDMSMLEFIYDGNNSHRVAKHSVTIFNDEFYKIR